MKRIIVFVAICFSLTGCAAVNRISGKVLTSMGFGSTEARAVEKAETKVEVKEVIVEKQVVVVDQAREDLLKKTQEQALVTDLALSAAPESRPVEVAKESSAQVVAGLDQALAPLTPTARNSIKSMVNGLLSENAEIRAKAETDASKARESLEATSTRLATAETVLAQQKAALEAAQQALDVANQKAQVEAKDNLVLANQMRAQLFQIWLLRVGAVVLTVAGLAAFVFAKLRWGGLLSTIVGRIEAFKTKRGDADPAVNELLTLLSSKMSRWEKAVVSKVKAKAP